MQGNLEHVELSSNRIELLPCFHIMSGPLAIIFDLDDLDLPNKNPVRILPKHDSIVKYFARSNVVEH